ncbi:F-box protein skip31 [Phtheirospermum japonicum]|uniref:F-box protein skip31 n=1 Tax=Phtheirospermum japonicum TaxID=374723 RepID=A0A830BBG7_9LAMI|nr:F-box protein skip31 [Phtheirospermum japonicum]
MASGDEDERLAYFLESEVLSELSDPAEFEEKERDEKRSCVQEDALSQQEETEQQKAKKIKIEKGEISTESKKPIPNRIETGIFGQIPNELIYRILKFLSSEDLVSCSLVCRFLNFAAADESLWRHLYCMRWGLLPPKKLRECAWKKLYIQRDEDDMAEFVRNCPSEFKEYYIQMQVAKRSQTPHPSQVNDDRVILDKTLADQVSMWKSSRGLAETVVLNHECSGESCTYYQIGDVFVCEKTGNVHVCDDTCKEVVMDPTNELLVCTISGRCFDRLLSPAEMEPDAEQQQGVITDEAEPFMGSGRFARAYLLGYNCEDERELEVALRFC